MPKIAIATALLLCTVGLAAEPAALVLEATVPLGQVEGRLDHLAMDLGRRHLFVAELGNDSVGVVDVGALRLLRTLSGFSEPQGIGYSTTTDELLVANGGDGAVLSYSAESFAPSGKILLGADADNMRMQIQPPQIFIGYGQGALAVIDARTKSRVADIPLQGHPEGFQLLLDTQRALVNVPGRNEIAVIDIHAAKQIASWPMGDTQANFPMAVDEIEQVAWVATRQPARLIAFAVATGARRESLESCADADDVMIDNKRHRIYVSCGSGHIDVWEARGTKHVRIARIQTVPGARTALFVPELDRLYIAVRANQGAPAAIWVYRPEAAISGPP